MSKLEFKWPDDVAERVRVARGRVEQAGEALRSMSFEDRLRSVALVLDDWTGADSNWRRELALRFPEESPLHEKTIREGLDAALRAWKSEDLIACARREIATTRDSNSIELSPFAWTAVLGGGGIPMPTLLSGLLPLIVGSPVLMREPSSDRVTGSLLKRSLEARNEELGRAFESIWFPSDDIALEELLEAPCVVATGSDETIRAISQRLRPNQRFVAYGHQFSVGVLGPALDLDDGALRETSAAFALDIARWDQSGCLSPAVLYLVGVDADHRERIASAVADALEELHERMPRGRMSTVQSAQHAYEIAEARMRQADGKSMLVEGSDFVVVLEANASARAAPLQRFIRLMPVDSSSALLESLAPFAGHLSNVACVGFSEIDAIALQESLSGLGVSRITKPGQLQTPPIDWPHDGMPLLTPIARFIQSI